MRALLHTLARNLDDAIEARRLLQPNARTRAAFDGQVLGRFERTGPNPWDTYRFVPAREEGTPLRVFPGIEVQVASAGAAVRMRARGTVLLVAWIPDGDLAGTLAWEDTPDIDRGPLGPEHEAARTAFLERCVTPVSNARGIGATAFIARTLDTGRRPG